MARAKLGADGAQEIGKTARTRDPEATRLAFLTAGEALFATHGFHATTLDMLAERAGANKAMVRYYFSSKEGLYDAVIAFIVDEVVASVAGRKRVTGDPITDFRRYILALIGALDARSTFAAILMREYAGGGALRPQPAQELVRFFGMTREHYQACLDAGLFRRLDPHILHLSIVGPAIQFVLARNMRAANFGNSIKGVSDPDIKKFAKDLAKIIIDGARSA